MATVQELKVILDAWIPKYIRQVVALRAGDKLTAERYNELMNLLIEQGDDTIALGSTVKNYVEAMTDEEAAARDLLLQTVNSAVADTISSVNGALASAVSGMATAVSDAEAASTQAIADTEAIGLRVDGYHTAVMTEVANVISALQVDIDSVQAALTAAGAVVEDAAAIYIALGNKANVGHLHDDRYYTEAEVVELINVARAGLLDAAPTTLNTLKKLALAVGNDPSFSATTGFTLALKAPLANPVFTNAKAAAGTDYTTARFRNTNVLTALPADTTGYVNGDIVFIKK